MCLRARASVQFSTKIRDSPESGLVRSRMFLISVVLPTPLSPIRPNSSPGARESDTSSSTRLLSYRLVIFRISKGVCIGLLGCGCRIWGFCRVFCHKVEHVFHSFKEFLFRFNQSLFNCKCADHKSLIRMHIKAYGVMFSIKPYAGKELCAVIGFLFPSLWKISKGTRVPHQAHFLA